MSTVYGPNLCCSLTRAFGRSGVISDTHSRLCDRDKYLVLVYRATHVFYVSCANQVPILDTKVHARNYALIGVWLSR